MTCKIEAGYGWGYPGDISGLLYKQEAALTTLGIQVEVMTGGMNSPTVICIKGDIDHLNHSMVGKVKPWSSHDKKGFSIYGNGAEVSLINPEDPFYLNLKVTNLPKKNVDVI